MLGFDLTPMVNTSFQYSRLGRGTKPNIQETVSTQPTTQNLMETEMVGSRAENKSNYKIWRALHTICRRLFVLSLFEWIGIHKLSGSL